MSNKNSNEKSYLKLSKPVRPFYPNELQEINKVRACFQENGRYKGLPAGYYTPLYMDPPLINAVREYQKDRGLQCDGIINPGGETEQRLNQDKQIFQELHSGLTGANSSTYNEKKERFSNIRQVTGAAADFMRHKKEMQEMNMKGSDKFFHCAANFTAAQRGSAGENAAKALSFGKELFDIPKKVFLNKEEVVPTLIDSLWDIEADAAGWTAGKNDRAVRKSSAAEACKEYLTPLSEGKKLGEWYRARHRGSGE